MDTQQHSLRAVRVTLDSNDPDRTANFWQAALGFRRREGNGNPYITLSDSPAGRPLKHLTIQRVRQGQRPNRRGLIGQVFFRDVIAGDEFTGEHTIDFFDVFHEEQLERVGCTQRSSKRHDYEIGRHQLGDIVGQRQTGIHERLVNAAGGEIGDHQSPKSEGLASCDATSASGPSRPHQRSEHAELDACLQAPSLALGPRPQQSRHAYGALRSRPWACRVRQVQEKP